MASQHKIQPFIFHDELVAEDFMNPAMTVMRDAFDPEYGEGWNYMQTLSMLAMPLSHNQVALSASGDPAAFTLSRAVADEEELLLIAVHPGFRGNRLGEAMLLRLFDQSRARGCKKVFLEVRHNNFARRLYEKMQFIQTGERTNYYTGQNGAKFDALTYTREL
ncbi:GNAT family N-acetyltransferase [Sphingorhabdus sp. Alg239-R122]|uniref:GNAT family N-acetyltransferase n=1 Tax=Sphingorhabdus sp. Alg239-R122 TaxID=2305989 RepID=UPI001F07175F|nr:GNAT family N-acetyltransferase [Sphingorhabdus sp. Alg239-R122]